MFLVYHLDSTATVLMHSHWYWNLDIPYHLYACMGYETYERMRYKPAKSFLVTGTHLSNRYMLAPKRMTATNGEAKFVRELSIVHKPYRS